MTEVADTAMGDTQSGDSRLPFSEDEKRVLELYDKIQELRLEIAIINAQSSQQTDETLDEDIKSVQNALLEARARYKLRNDVVQSVMMAAPILKAVHNGTEASPIERDILPYVEKRDKISISVAKDAETESKLREDSTSAQVEIAKLCRENVNLTAELFDLAEQVKQKQAGHFDIPETREEVAKLEGETKSSRQRWKVMKGVASCVIAGSGVDYIHDKELLEIVLDREEDDLAR